MTPPNKIYLQTGDIPDDAEWDDLVGVTWHSKRVHDSDVEYVRADEIKALLPGLRNRLQCYHDGTYGRSTVKMHVELKMISDIEKLIEE